MYIVLCNYRLKPGSREKLLKDVREENLLTRIKTVKPRQYGES